VPRLCEFYPGICLTTEEKATQLRKQRTTEEKVFENRKLERGFSHQISVSSCHILDTHLEQTAGTINWPFETAPPRTSKTKRKVFILQTYLGPISAETNQFGQQQNSPPTEYSAASVQPHKEKEDATL
jgi:hypothetical protein